MDSATSTNPAVQAQLDRLTMLSPGADILGLSRIATLLDRLGNPHLKLPPVFHVAGTNGKGSTCAFLRAALEAEGHRVHAYTSPHLVRFNERIRIAGTLIDDATLAPLLARVLDIADGTHASFFEVSTAAAFLAFAEVPADACVIEVGLGGRLDATNVIADPAACGIAQLGVDHQAFLGDSAVQIAREKAGIAKPGRPLVVQAYPAEIAVAVAEVAAQCGAPVLPADRDWRFALTKDPPRRRPGSSRERPDAGPRPSPGWFVHYADSAGALPLPAPALAGSHQAANLALAVAMLRHQDRIGVSDQALVTAATSARWPARMQRLADGPLTRRLAPGTPVWLDGGHNPAAATAVATALATALDEAKAHIILGMLANKDAAGFLAPFAPIAASLTAVPIPGHDHHAPERLAAIAEALGIPARVAADVPTSLTRLAAEPRAIAIAILGSLYLAGEVLAANDELPD